MVHTFFKSMRFVFQLKLARVCDNDLLGAFARLRSIGFNLLDDFHALDNLAENDVLAIEPRCLGSTNKELGPIGVGTSIGHAEDARPVCLSWKFSSSNLFP